VSYKDREAFSGFKALFCDVFPSCRGSSICFHCFCEGGRGRARAVLSNLLWRGSTTVRLSSVLSTVINEISWFDDQEEIRICHWMKYSLFRMSFIQVPV